MPRRKSYNFGEMSHKDVARVLGKTDVVMVPMGSLEQHGAHLPLSTDAMTTISVVEKAAEKGQVPFVPMIPMGYSPHHMGVMGKGTGTLTFSGETYRRIVYEIAKGLIFHGFNKIVFVSQHGSNIKVVDDILRRIRYETDCFVCWYKTPTEREYSILKDIIEGPPEETPGWHAGEIETSILMAFDETLVDMKEAVKDKTHAPAWMGPEFSKKDGTATVAFEGSENIWVPMEHHEYSDSATIGNPFRGSKEKGEKYFEIASDHLASFLKEVKKFKIEVKSRDFPDRA